MGEVYTSRSMAPEFERALERMKAGPHDFDGRTPQGTLDRLQTLKWIEKLDVAHKNPLKATFKMTEAGRYALERQLRGVDPYLRMTG